MSKTTETNHMQGEQDATLISPGPSNVKRSSEGRERKLEEQVQELVKANAGWEKYMHDLKNQHESQMSSLTKELSVSRTRVEELEERDRQREKGVDQINRKADERIKSAEEEKKTAVTVATHQSKKVDELKVSLQQEKTKSIKLQEKITYLEKAVHNLRLENTKLKEQVSGMSADIHADCRKKVQELETQLMVLKEQLKVFRSDFDTERSDREKAQTEIISLETQLLNATKEIKSTKTELVLKDREVQALREANRELQAQLEEAQTQLQLERQRKQRPYYEGPKYNVHIERTFDEVGVRRSPSPNRVVNTILSEEQKRKLRKHWTLFIDNMMVDEIIPILFSQNVLSLNEKQQISAKHTMFDKGEFLMSNVIMRGTQRDLRHFKSALIETNQAFLAEYVPVPAPATSRAYQYEEEEPMEVPEVKAVPPTWKCTECTYENNILRSNCEMCGRLKKQPEYMMSRGVDQCDNRVKYNSVGDVEED